MKKIPAAFLSVFSFSTNKLNPSNLFYKVTSPRSLTFSPPSPLVPLQMLCIVLEVPRRDLGTRVPAEALPGWKGHFAYLAHDISARVPLGDICFHGWNVTLLTPAVVTVVVNSKRSSWIQLFVTLHSSVSVLSKCHLFLFTECTHYVFTLLLHPSIKIL